MVVTLHPPYIQVLHADGTHLAVVRERMGNFVKVVLTAVGYMLLQPGYFNTGLAAV